MIFHRVITPLPADDASIVQRQAGKPQYKPDLSRLIGAFLLLLLLIVAAFVGYAIKWMDAATAFLHLTEVAAGGLAGLFFGERSAIKTLAT